MWGGPLEGKARSSHINQSGLKSRKMPLLNEILLSWTELQLEKAGHMRV